MTTIRRTYRTAGGRRGERQILRREGSIDDVVIAVFVTVSIIIIIVVVVIIVSIVVDVVAAVAVIVVVVVAVVAVFEILVVVIYIYIALKSLRLSSGRHVIMSSCNDYLGVRVKFFPPTQHHTASQITTTGGFLFPFHHSEISLKCNAHFGGPRGESRTGEDLKNKFKALKGVKKPTADISCPPEVCRAKLLQRDVEARVDRLYIHPRFYTAV